VDPVFGGQAAVQVAKRAFVVFFVTLPFKFNFAWSNQDIRTSDVVLRSQFMINPILEQVRHRIDVEGISLAAASNAIGVGVSSMTRHLAGDYVRSDSLAKYRLWLTGDNVRQARESVPFEKSSTSLSTDAPPQFLGLGTQPALPKRPRYVVDLFCGCGGMSLGFERFEDGQVYQIAMALDIEEPMVRVFNDNHPSPSGKLPIARRGDISEFMNEAEILAYYLDHLARTTGDRKLSSSLMSLGPYSLDSLRRSLYDIDIKFQERLMSIRSDREYASALRSAGSNSLSQTSVIGFHNATKLPLTSNAYPKLGPVIWHDDGGLDSDIAQATVEPDEKLIKACTARARKLWFAEVQKLVSRAEGSGRGQLASAADRINRFIDLLDSKPLLLVRDHWVKWRASREAVRITFLDNPVVQERLREIYKGGHQVSVLLGGPPCQGFSRIGRGKIRSLREQSVHVHEDEDSVDSRNQLMHQYVLFVSALAPEVFLFENVRHFQAVVRSEGIEFDAADILAEAIEAVSAGGLGYAVARDIIVASKHAVPQARERFVMAGIRRDLDDALAGLNAASWCLSLQAREPLPLQTALEGLPEPFFVNQPGASTASRVFAARVPSSPESITAADVYRTWTYRNLPVDGHIARPPRQDDGAFFALMGPGKRWMDYRCDDAPTLKLLGNVLNTLKSSLDANSTLAQQIGLNPKDVGALVAAMDGSLSLRLLLESIEPVPGEVQHHLLTSTYLQKREGAHGDWLARMNASQPSKTIVSHMAKDTYAYVHPTVARTLSVREAARVQSFPDDYKFGSVGLVDGFKVVGNAVPPLLSLQFAERVAQVLARVDASGQSKTQKTA
jgi:site-specific DNA-cytosine methylase